MDVDHAVSAPQRDSARDDAGHPGGDMHHQEQAEAKRHRGPYHE
jgi:hypothetical protein